MGKEYFGSSHMTQVGVIVRDIEKSAKANADLFGVEVPDVMITDPEEKANTRYKGEPSEARAKLEKVVSDYPDKTASRLAARRLEQMSSEGR